MTQGLKGINEILPIEHFTTSGCDSHHVLESNTTISWEINPRFDGHYHIFLKHHAFDSPQTRLFMHREAHTVSQTMSEALTIPCLRNQSPRCCIHINALNP